MSNELPNRDYLFLHEAARYLGISRATFYLRYYQYLVRLDTTRMLGSRPQYWIEDLKALRQNVNLANLQARGERMRRVREGHSTKNKKVRATSSTLPDSQPNLFDWKREESENGSEI